MPASRPAASKSTSKSTSRADDTLGSGIESGVVVLVFAGIGYGLDRWLDTSPILTLVLFALGAVGVFYRYKAAYSLRIDADAEERRRSSTTRDPGGDRS